MNRFAQSSADERRLVIEEAAVQLDLLPVIVEKDYWVCWTLGQLFRRPTLANNVVFKGGTSLSKVFGAIQRFSEDIDLSVAPTSLGFAETELNEATSKSKRDKLVKKLQEACAKQVQDVWRRELEEAITTALGPPPGPTWLEYRHDERTDSPELWFAYPSAIASKNEYIASRIKLEFGSLTDQQPTGRHPVRPLLDEAFPQLKWEPETVVALEVERTFWEKATILHAEYHRPANKPIPDRFARHYSDLAALWQHESRTVALENIALLERVALFKTRFFGSAWAHYDTARRGTLCLCPTEERIAELERDYEKMQPMFLVEPPSFAAILEILRTAEAEINQ